LLQKLEDFLQIKANRTFEGGLPWIEAGASYDGSTFWSRSRYEIFSRICFDVMSEYGFKFENQIVDTKDTIHLRPPFTTSDDTRIIAEKDEFVFCEPDVDGVWVMIHPNDSGGRPTQLIYRNVCLYGHNKFHAKIKLDGMDSKPVTIRVHVLRSNDHHSICEGSIDLNSGDKKEWVVRFAQTFAVCDVEISSTMTASGDSNNCAWAKILKPKMMLEDR
ncbi:MAG: hypothetical protein JO228_16365, partial [Xanthobacteraceae bacterium]|nr:hypothetical protein [Xanthobacteraceae bacterium]